MSAERHGDPIGPIVLPAEDDPDPDLWLVNADMSTFLAWERANCRCDALCTCRGG